MGSAATGEPEREHPGLQGNALSHGLALPSRSLVGQDKRPQSRVPEGFAGTLATLQTATLGSPCPAGRHTADRQSGEPRATLSSWGRLNLTLPLGLGVGP